MKDPERIKSIGEAAARPAASTPIHGPATRLPKREISQTPRPARRGLTSQAAPARAPRESAAGQPGGYFPNRWPSWSTTNGTRKERGEGGEGMRKFPSAITPAAPTKAISSSRGGRPSKTPSATQAEAAMAAAGMSSATAGGQRRPPNEVAAGSAG